MREELLVWRRRKYVIVSVCVVCVCVSATVCVRGMCVFWSANLKIFLADVKIASLLRGICGVLERSLLTMAAGKARP